MVNPKTQVIDVSRAHCKWQKLLVYLQNRIPDVFILEFPDELAAKRAEKNISRALRDGVPGCTMMHVHRGCNVYIVKLQNAQKVVIHEEV